MSFKIQRDITSVACSVFSDFSVSAGLFSSKKLQKPSPLMLVTQLAIYQEWRGKQNLNYGFLCQKKILLTCFIVHIGTNILARKSSHSSQ